MTGIWDDVVGQSAAVEQLRRAAEAPTHAYLFVGPPGSTKERAARAFAARLLTRSDDAGGRDARLVLAGEHPDVREVEREGAAILKDPAREIVRLASLAPVEGDRKVMILHEFHLLSPEAAGVLLKTVEEPPPSTTFLILADFVPRELVTIASRSIRIDFRPIGAETIADRLVLEGVDPESASEAAQAAGGDLDRARLLAGDPELAARRRLFAAVPTRLDGTGATAMRLVDELLAAIETAAAPLVARQTAEVEELEERIAAAVVRGVSRRSPAERQRDTMEKRHKRELRRHRTDELRAGLAALAGTYRDALVAGHVERPDALADAVHRIHTTMDVLDRNPNETLQLQALLWNLPSL
jgi:DNA polymerase-3 subunit delta'